MTWQLCDNVLPSLNDVFPGARPAEVCHRSQTQLSAGLVDKCQINICTVLALSGSPRLLWLGQGRFWCWMTECGAVRVMLDLQFQLSELNRPAFRDGIVDEKNRLFDAWSERETVLRTSPHMLECMGGLVRKYLGAPHCNALQAFADAHAGGSIWVFTFLRVVAHVYRTLTPFQRPGTANFTRWRGRHFIGQPISRVIDANKCDELGDYCEIVHSLVATLPDGHRGLTMGSLSVIASMNFFLKRMMTLGEVKMQRCTVGERSVLPVLPGAPTFLHHPSDRQGSEKTPRWTSRRGKKRSGLGQRYFLR